MSLSEESNIAEQETAGVHEEASMSGIIYFAPSYREQMDADVKYCVDSEIFLSSKKFWSVWH